MNRVAIALAVFGLWLLPLQASAQADIHCPRPHAGSEVTPPPDLFSSNGALNISLSYYTRLDEVGRTIFCFQTPDGLQSPTLHVNPGDAINIALANAIPPIHGGPTEAVTGKGTVCGNPEMTLTSVNMHFHGTNTSPKCHSDEVIRTLVNSGETFNYSLKIPKDEPPGLYWYHPHIHGIASMTVEGGASGAIIVEGIENIQPAVAGLPQRLIVVRDQMLRNAGISKEKPVPNWDVSINYVPVPYPHYPPAVINTTYGVKEFWRVVNASANTILDLQIVYDGLPQTLQVAGLDGVPTGSQDGKRQGTLIEEKHVLLPPAGRAEFLATMPTENISRARLVTRTIDGGSLADSNPARPLANIVAVKAGRKLPRVPQTRGSPNAQRFENIDSAKVTANRKLYFWEVPTAGAKFPEDQVLFFITVDGQNNIVYNPDNPPAVITHKGAVEDWTIENRTGEVHEFHMHQIHFRLLEINGRPVPKERRQWYDTFQVPYWDGKGKYPNIKVRMDFRGAVVGDFVYHCHILEHEDAGMMAIIRVKPPKTRRQR